MYEQETQENALSEAIDLLKGDNESALKEDVDWIAQGFRYFHKAEVDGPRIKDAISEITQLKERAGSLRRSIECIDSLTAHALVWGDWSFRETLFSYDSEQAELVKQAGFELGETYKLGAAPLRPELAWEPLQWISRLKGLEALAAAAQQSAPKDKGGASKLSKREHGPAKLRLAFDCYWIFSKHRPGEAKKTRQGDFHLFTEAVYRYATGNEGKGIYDVVSRCLGLATKVEEIESQIAANEMALETSRNAAEKRHLMAELESLYKALDDALI